METSNKQGKIKIALKNDVKTGESIIRKINSISTPGMRKYSNAKGIPRILNGLGISIVSTSMGVMTGKEAKKKNLPIYKRGDMLAHITSLKKNIVVSGSHGKTTTTSLIASIFAKAKLDPTIINGGVINSLENSAKLGRSEWSILESDESDGSFVKVPSTYSVVTNIDREHMDFYKSLDDLKEHLSLIHI